MYAFVLELEQVELCLNELHVFNATVFLHKS